MIDMLINAMEELDEEKVTKIIKRCIAANTEKEKLWYALNSGLQKVGFRYENGEYSIADLMVAGIIFENVIPLIPMDIQEDVRQSARDKTMILGTIEGDLHDIGKSIFKGTMQAAGFKVIDLGIDVKPEAFLENTMKYKAEIMGISAILTQSIPFVKETIEKITDAGLRDKVKIIIGGCIANKTVSDFVGADAYTKSAIKGVEICKGWV